MSPTLLYALGLGTTIAIETPLAALALRPTGWRKIVPWAVAANVLTHASMHFVLPRLGLSPLAWEIAGECQALVVEAAVFALVIRPRSAWLALAASAACNGSSYLIGIAFFG